jgi:hypothetical protein
MCMYMYTCVIHIHTHACMHTLFVPTCASIWKCVCMYLHLCICACIHACMHTHSDDRNRCIHTYMHAPTHTYMHPRRTTWTFLFANSEGQQRVRPSHNFPSSLYKSLIFINMPTIDMHVFRGSLQPQLLKLSVKVSNFISMSYI